MTFHIDFSNILLFTCEKEKSKIVKFLLFINKTTNKKILSLKVLKSTNEYCLKKKKKLNTVHFHTSSRNTFTIILPLN